MLARPDHLLKLVTCAVRCARDVNKVLVPLIDSLNLCLGVAVINHLPLTKTPQVGHVRAVRRVSQHLNPICSFVVALIELLQEVEP